MRCILFQIAASCDSTLVTCLCFSAWEKYSSTHWSKSSKVRFSSFVYCSSKKKGTKSWTTFPSYFLRISADTPDNIASSFSFLLFAAISSFYSSVLFGLLPAASIYFSLYTINPGISSTSSIFCISSFSFSAPAISCCTWSSEVGSTLAFGSTLFRRSTCSA